MNDWFASKNNLGSLLQQAITSLSGKIDDPELGETMADVLGDVLWPVLVADARAAVREAFLAQLKQIVMDGVAAGVPARDQRLSIICHSLGCFHTYEVLHHAAASSSHLLQPATHGVRFRNVIFMASPVQLIRTVADAMGSAVPNRRWLYTAQGETLSIPEQQKTLGGSVKSVDNWVSITGELDPVGGWFFRQRADWACMQVPGEAPCVVDDQRALNIGSKAELRAAMLQCMRDRQPPFIALNNPHSWDAYVDRHATLLRQWVMS